MPELSSELEPSVLGLNPPPPASEEGIYRFSVEIAYNGFTIDGEAVPDLTTLLKHVIAIVNEHPNSQEASEQLSAGYQSGKEPIVSPASY